MSAIVAAANCEVTAGASGAFIVTKTGGADGVPDSSAVSAASIDGDLLLRVRLLGEGTAYAGLGAAPLGANDSASIERAVQLNPGLGRIFESGVSRPPLFAVVGFVWLRRTAGQLEYLVGTGPGALTVRRTVSGIVAPLHFDCSLLTLGAAIEVKFGPPSAFVATRWRRPRLSLGFGL